ncbi:hypothetical protein J1605_021754 [Eschrichtius robustus]|uniref:Ig-like domain-containing protein n=1 Tax=Eschrichtius robustus TaxID=9764 RepID=A0AB34HDE5_ESCRO|nr:hypothetical protein J1605_021754 [Eschrichtius robustus]
MTAAPTQASFLSLAWTQTSLPSGLSASSLGPCLSQSRCSCVWEERGREGPLSLALLALSVSLAPEVLGNATSLRVVEGQSLRLACAVDSNPPARISWARGCLTLSPSQPLDPGVLELPQVVLGDGGELTCRAQHLRGSLRVSLNLVVQDEYKQGCLSSELGWCLRFLPPSLWGAAGLLAPSPHLAQGGPDGGWFPSHLWPHLDLLYQQTFHETGPLLQNCVSLTGAETHKGIVLRGVSESPSSRWCFRGL